MFTVNAYAATSATEPLVPMTVERRDVGPHDVLIEIKYTGICHSDIHHARSDWGAETYPLVPGHEIAGVVSEVGSEVTRYAVGDRVGVGCMVDSCRECVNCRKGQEQYCLKGNTLTYGSLGEDGRLTQGGYATHIVVTEDFVLRIPDGDRTRRRRARCCARASRPTHRCAAGAPVPARRWPSSAWAGSATWPSSSRTRWAPRSPCSRSR